MGGVDGGADVDEDAVRGEEEVAHFGGRVDAYIGARVTQAFNDLREGDAAFGNEVDAWDFRAGRHFGIEGDEWGVDGAIEFAGDEVGCGAAGDNGGNARARGEGGISGILGAVEGASGEHLGDARGAVIEHSGGGVIAGAAAIEACGTVGGAFAEDAGADFRCDADGFLEPGDDAFEALTEGCVGFAEAGLGDAIGTEEEAVAEGHTKGGVGHLSPFPSRKGIGGSFDGEDLCASQESGRRIFIFDHSHGAFGRGFDHREGGVGDVPIRTDGQGIHDEGGCAPKADVGPHILHGHGGGERGADVGLLAAA